MNNALAARLQRRPERQPNKDEALREHLRRQQLEYELAKQRAGQEQFDQAPPQRPVPPYEQQMPIAPPSNFVFPWLKKTF